MRTASTTPAVRTPGPDVTWGRFLQGFAVRLHAADQLQLDHLAADVECFPPSPVAERMRAAVAAEQTLRAVTR